MEDSRNNGTKLRALDHSSVMAYPANDCRGMRPLSSLFSRCFRPRGASSSGGARSRFLSCRIRGTLTRRDSDPGIGSCTHNFAFKRFLRMLFARHRIDFSIFKPTDALPCFTTGIVFRGITLPDHSNVRAQDFWMAKEHGVHTVCYAASIEILWTKRRRILDDIYQRLFPLSYTVFVCC